MIGVSLLVCYNSNMPNWLEGVFFLFAAPASYIAKVIYGESRIVNIVTFLYYIFFSLIIVVYFSERYSVYKRAVISVFLLLVHAILYWLAGNMYADAISKIL